MLKSHQIGEQCVLSILPINQSEFGKTFPECSKAAIRVPTLINYPSWSIRCSNYITVSMLTNMLVSSSTGPNIILSHVIINPNNVD